MADTERKGISHLQREYLELQALEYWYSGDYNFQAVGLADTLMGAGLFTLIENNEQYITVYVSDKKMIIDGAEATWAVQIRKLGDMSNWLVRTLRKCLVPKPSYKITYRRRNGKICEMGSVDTTRLVLALIVGPDAIDM